MSGSTREELLAALTREWTWLGAELVLLSQSVADRLKINVTDLQCLAVVSSAGAMTAGQIAEATGLTTGAITGVIDRLEKAGLVRREDDPADRRRVMVRALPGDALAARDPAVGAALAGLTAATADQYEGYSDRELQLVVDALARAHPLLLEHVAGLRDQPQARHELGAPMAGAKAGRLLLAPGLGSITIDSDRTLAELYRANVEGTPPFIEVEGETVTVRPRRFPLFGWGHRNLRLTLSGTIPWDIEVDQGAVRLTADLADAPVRSFSINGGASRVDLRLGRPSGVVPIVLGGGASNVTVRRPRDVPVELRIKGGSTHITVDGHRMASSAGHFAWHPPRMPEGADRYAIEVRGGASKVSVEPG
jgi:DNA-binding MarR family transcriptional regulator